MLLLVASKTLCDWPLVFSVLTGFESLWILWIPQLLALSIAWSPSHFPVPSALRCPQWSHTCGHFLVTHASLEISWQREAPFLPQTGRDPLTSYTDSASADPTLASIAFNLPLKLLCHRSLRPLPVSSQ